MARHFAKCSDPIFSFETKIDLFMQDQILPFFNPEEVDWWLSLSGGKDSYAMAIGIRQWYQKKGFRLSAKGLHIDQWGANAAGFVRKKLAWLEIIIINAQKLTLEKTGYQPGDQAPCRKCADVRRLVGDEIIFPAAKKTKRVQFIARGLHLSDTALSLLWRFIRGKEPELAINSSSKGWPTKEIAPKVYLVKPLAYIREYESQIYAHRAGFQKKCCGCPACHVPSRRDLVEETALPFVHTPLWELTIPDMTNYLTRIGTNQLESKIKKNSSPGIETKTPSLPDGFTFSATNYFRSWLHKMPAVDLKKLNFEMSLDEIGVKRLTKQVTPLQVKNIPAPALLDKNWIPSASEMGMIATLGPFWGAIGLDPINAQEAWKLQEKICDFVPDDQWSQVKKMLTLYYQQNGYACQATCDKNNN